MVDEKEALSYCHMFSPSAIADFLACQHLNALNRAATSGKIKKPYFADPGAELLRRLGLEHELKYLNELKGRGLRVVEISTDVPWSQTAAATLEAMVQGADVIYQATFIHEPWAGRADFLIRVEMPSELGDWSYEVVETKLAKSTKARALIQLCLYSELAAAIQGKVPERMYVVLGRGAQPEEFSVQRYLAYFRKVKREFQAALAARPITYPEPVEHCNVCDWFLRCDERRHADDHLSLVAGITRNQRKALVEREISSVEKLATLTLPVTPKIDRIAPAPLLRIREQARVQVLGRERGEPVYELLDPDEAKKNSKRKPEGSETANPDNGKQEQGHADEALRGLAALPLASPGDLFLDFEGDPFAFEQGLEYLIGTVTVAVDGTPIYETIWSFDPKSERRAFVEFINKVKQIRSAIRTCTSITIRHMNPPPSNISRVVMGSALMKSTNCCALKSSGICFALCVRVYVRRLRATRSRRWSRSTILSAQSSCVMRRHHCKPSNLCLHLAMIRPTHVVGVLPTL